MDMVIKDLEKKIIQETFDIVKGVDREIYNVCFVGIIIKVVPLQNYPLYNMPYDSKIINLCMDEFRVGLKDSGVLFLKLCTNITENCVCFSNLWILEKKDGGGEDYNPRNLIAVMENCFTYAFKTHKINQARYKTTVGFVWCPLNYNGDFVDNFLSPFFSKFDSFFQNLKKDALTHGYGGSLVECSPEFDSLKSLILNYLDYSEQK